MKGSGEDDRLTGTNGPDWIRGLAGYDLLWGRNGDDRLFGADSDDSLLGGAGDDTLRGGEHSDVLQGGAGDDLIRGGRGKDTVSYADAAAGVRVDLSLRAAQDTGDAGVDTLRGVESLRGSAFDDVLGGDLASNLLHGGGGDDVFRWGALADLHSDRIGDYGAGDVLDLSAIDADETTVGDQPFHLVSAFTLHAGEAKIRWDGVHGETIIYLDVDGDGVSDGKLGLLWDQTANLAFVL